MTNPMLHSATSTLAELPKLDLYGLPHKGLRLVFSAVVTRLGALDTTNPSARREVLGSLEESLWLLEHHLKHEEQYIHPALESRRPGAREALDREHEAHARAIGELRHLTAALDIAQPSALPGLVRHLYLRYTDFVAENYVHMVEEEQGVQRLLDDAYGMEELLALELALVSSIPPNVMMAFLKYMVPAINRDERVTLLQGPKASLPPDAFAAMLGMLKPTLADADFDDLATRLGVAA